MKEIRQDREFAVQSMSVSRNGDPMSDRFRIMQSMSQAHNGTHERGTGNCIMNTTSRGGAQEARYGLNNDRRYRGITQLGSNNEAKEGMTQSLNSIRSRRDVTHVHSDSMREMSHSPYGIRNRREVTRVHSDSMREMPQSFYSIRNRREVTHTNSDSMQRMPKSRYGIRNKGITHMSQALDPRQERQPIHIQEESVRVSSYIGKRSNINSNNTVPRSLNGVIPSTNQEDVGEFTNQQRNRVRVEDGLSRSFKDVRDTFIDRSSQYKGMTLMDDDNYGNKNTLEANAAIQPDQELIKLSTSSFDNRNLCTNDSAPTISIMPDKYGAGTKDSKIFVQQHNHIITPVAAAAATMENETEQKQQDRNSDSKTINESMKVLMEYMTHSAMSRKLVKQFTSPFTNTTSDDKTPLSSLSNSTSLLLSSNNKQRVVVKAKRNSIGRCKHNKPQRMKEYRSSCRKRFDFSFDTTTRCDSPTPDAAFATSAVVHPSAPSPSNNNNNFFSNQPHQHPYFPSHNNNDCDENSVLMESSLFPTIQAPEDNYSITNGAHHLSNRNNVDDNVDHDDNDNDNDNDNDIYDLSLTPTVVSQLLFMNLPVTNNHNGNNVNDDDDIVSVSSTTTGTSWLWRTAEATTTTTTAAAK